jgi:hypothetical protein
MRFTLLVLCAMISGSATVAAQTGETQRACAKHGAPNQEYERDSAKEWPHEAQRYKSNEQNVSRQRNRLRLALEGGKTIQLVDCPYGDRAYQYLYERYDEGGRFYVIRTPAHEDFSYTLAVHGPWRAGLGGRQVEISDGGVFAAAAARQPRHSGAFGRRAGDGSRNPTALREGKLFGALGFPVVGLGDVHAARSGQEGHGVRRDPWQRWRLEKVRALRTHGWERATQRATPVALMG